MGVLWRLLVMQLPSPELTETCVIVVVLWLSCRRRHRRRRRCCFAQVSLLAWTTTPWTLPSNLALCVNEKMTYVKVRDEASNNVYILAEDRLVELYKKGAKAKGKKGGFEELEKMPGSDLVGTKCVRACVRACRRALPEKPRVLLLHLSLVVDRAGVVVSSFFVVGGSVAVSYTHLTLPTIYSV